MEEGGGSQARAPCEATRAGAHQARAGGLPWGRAHSLNGQRSPLVGVWHRRIPSRSFSGGPLTARAAWSPRFSEGRPRSGKSICPCDCSMGWFFVQKQLQNGLGRSGRRGATGSPCLPAAPGSLQTCRPGSRRPSSRPRGHPGLPTSPLLQNFGQFGL